MSPSGDGPWSGACRRSIPAWRAFVLFGVLLAGASLLVPGSVENFCYDAAALHPSMPAMVRDVTLTGRRLIGLAAASLLGPLALGFQSLLGERVDVPVFVGASVLGFTRRPRACCTAPSGRRPA
jgi:hypothetical protein